ncbi:MAG: hypothetical protein LBQ15_08965 [Clostridium sp.]|jgi:hypothetical protein|nr:hypothetical protein [Clostridium sp.]
MSSARTRFFSDEVSAIFCFFMDSYVHSHKNGRGTMPCNIEFSLKPAISEFLETAMLCVVEGCPPIEFDIRIEMLYVNSMKSLTAYSDDISQLVLAKYLMYMLYTDDLDPFFDLCTLWSDSVTIHHYQYLYPNLSPDLQDKYREFAPPDRFYELYG